MNKGYDCSARGLMTPNCVNMLLILFDSPGMNKGYDCSAVTYGCNSFSKHFRGSMESYDYVAQLLAIPQNYSFSLFSYL